MKHDTSWSRNNMPFNPSQSDINMAGLRRDCGTTTVYTQNMQNGIHALIADKTTQWKFKCNFLITTSPIPLTTITTTLMDFYVIVKQSSSLPNYSYIFQLFFFSPDFFLGDHIWRGLFGTCREYWLYPQIERCVSLIPGTSSQPCTCMWIASQDLSAKHVQYLIITCKVPIGVYKDRLASKRLT